MINPYVVSADLGSLMQQWAENRGFTLPPYPLFQELRGRLVSFLQKMFSRVELVNEQELSIELGKFVQASGLLPLSMDGVYFRSEPSLGVTRAVYENGEDAGQLPRFGFPSLLEQIQEVKVQGIDEVVLIDDVVFSGGQLSFVISTLRQCGVSVPLVCAGVVVGEGYQRLAALGVEVNAVRRFDEVIDEICERDFYPGVPRSGRFVAESNNVGMPYILPFGRPGKWASIPDKDQQWFSKECIRLAWQLFSDIEKLSDRLVLGKDLARSFPGSDPDRSVVEVLGSFL